MKKIPQIVSLFLLVFLFRGFFPNYETTIGSNNFFFEEHQSSSDAKKFFDWLVEKTEVKSEKKEVEREIEGFDTPPFFFHEFGFSEKIIGTTFTKQTLYFCCHFDFRAIRSHTLYLLYHSLKLDC